VAGTDGSDVAVQVGGPFCPACFAASTFAYRLEPGKAVYFRTLGSASGVQTGRVRIQPSGGSPPVEFISIHRFCVQEQRRDNHRSERDGDRTSERSSALCRKRIWNHRPVSRQGGCASFLSSARSDPPGQVGQLPTCCVSQMCQGTRHFSPAISVAKIRAIPPPRGSRPSIAARFR
jgi:hypothetical protein